ncbi:MAG: bifunctional ADP-dependent NAD(P)H-hydrate dehydratase/NAD(P)H-hydrate epimerase, partial [Firmicutes bacterium]|nr:bifunctional ADP-dependent NAD(P)H-hydrate dehydratase/NAD(P)H-hydrate epimerase [Bacillota bacterium]
SVLLKSDPRNLKQDLMMAARRLASEYEAIAVLKGHNTLIAAPDEELFISLTGNSGMATAGSGDVLAGILAGISGKEASLQKTCMGVYLHGMAGDLAMKKYGRRSLIATDIIEMIPKAALEAGID